MKNIILILMLFSIVKRLLSCNVTNETYNALYAFFNSTNGYNWTTSCNYNWTFQSSYSQQCGWYGVTCNEQCQVIALSLPDCNLQGNLPTELVDLNDLQELILHENSLYGQIPSELGNMMNLTYLSLYSNNLSGTIPSDLGKLKNMNFLLLSLNHLSGTIPSELGDMRNTSLLFLDSNALTGTLPSELGNIINMTQLVLNSNSLHGSIPTSVASLSKMTYLYLNDNMFSGNIPTHFGLMKNLQELILHENSLYGQIPSELGNMMNLTQISLYSNNLSGTIPSDLGKLKNMNFLLLSLNHLSGTIPSELGDMRNTSLLFLDTNALTGTLPSELGNIVNMTQLSLNSNSLHGSIPTSVASLSKMTYLYLYDNMFSGNIPTHFGLMKSLTLFGLNGNRFTGRIPVEISNMKDMHYFFLNSNFLTGTVPVELSTMPKIIYFSLSSNSLVGTIPSALGNLKECLYFDLGMNQLSGTIPAELSSMIKLQQLYLYSNSLTGSIPSFIYSYKWLHYLYLYSNQLTGSIPIGLMSMPSLLEIDLSSNTQLTGDLDSFFSSSNTLQLQSIVLDNLHIEGSLPHSLFQLESIDTIVLSSNCLTGTLPDSICSASTLTTFILDGGYSTKRCSKSKKRKQRFQGTIPSCIFLSSSLNTLHLVGNGLYGTIPGNLSSTSAIQDLNLASNLLTGSIPTSVQAYKFSKVDLSYNKLTGTLADTYQTPSTFVNISVNRLSGKLASSIRDTNITVNVINGNLFGCPILSSDVDFTEDKGYAACGSITFEKPIYVWLCVVVALMILPLTLLRYYSTRYTIRLKQAVVSWWNASYQYLPSSVTINETSNETFEVGHAVKTMVRVEQICSASILLTVYFISVVMVSYIILKLHRYPNSMYQVQYLYTTTAAYMKGLSPSIVIWIFITLSGLIVTLFCTTSRTSGIAKSAGSGKGDVKRIEADEVTVAETYQEHLKVWVTQLIVITLLMGTALGMDIAFVYIYFFIAKSDDLSVISLTFGFFRFVVSSFLVPYPVRIFRKSSRVVYLVVMTVFVNLVSPAFAILLNSPFCLFYYRSPNSITDTYTISKFLTNENGFGFGNVPYTVSSQFTPEWLYSYQCSSSFLSTYLPLIAYLYIFNGVLSPVANFLLMILYSSKYNSTTEKLKFYLKALVSKRIVAVNLATYDIFSPSSTEKKTNIEMEEVSNNRNFHRTTTINNHVMEKDDSRTKSQFLPDSSSNEAYSIDVWNIISNLCVDITYLMTFGLASPILAVMITCRVLVHTFIWRLMIGRYINIYSKVISHGTVKNHLESTFSDLWRCLSDSWWMISILVGMFWSLFVFDMIGDINPSGGIIGAVLMLIWCPLLFINAQKLLKVSNNDTDSNDYRYHISSYMEKLVLSIHKFIWKFVIPFNNSISNSGSSNNSDNRTSEIVSPLVRVLSE